MRSWLYLILAACGADPVSAPVPVPPSLPATRAPTPAPPRTAAHGSDIVALATTADGLAAVSADRLGGIRLWPALDGTREPVVIQGRAPRALGLVRDGDGFAIALVDAAGGVRVVRTSAAGAVRGRLTVSDDQPATEVAATAEGWLILRADQTLALIDAAGAIRARLTPEPGTRIASLVTRGDRVLALIRDDRQWLGRWIVVRRGARWGDATPRLPFPIGHAALSPAGDRLAAVRPNSLHPALIDLARGTALDTPLCVTRRWPHDDGNDSVDTRELLRSDRAPVPLGFVTDKVVACAVMTSLIWWNTDGSQHASSGGSFPVATLPFAMTDRGLVVGTGPNLGFATPQTSRFLGYGVHDLTALRVTPGAVLVGGSDQQSLVLGAGLGERARFELARSRSDWSEVVPIDDRYAIVAAMQRPGDGKGPSFQLAVFDGLATAVHQQLPYGARDKELSYDPVTRLLATSDGAMAMLLRYDPASHTFGDPVRVGTAIAPSKLVVLDPRLSGGVVALAIDQAGDGLLVGELGDGDLRPGTTVQPRATFRVPGELRAVDRAGHLYVHRPSDRDDVAVYARDLVTAILPEVAALTLRPSADGSRIAAFASPRLVLLDRAGQVRWDSAQWSGADFDWTPAGDLVVQFPTGIARVDLATGELAERRCGWGFGLSERMLEVRHAGPSICDAP